jgi:hypothetical protein
MELEVDLFTDDEGLKSKIEKLDSVRSVKIEDCTEQSAKDCLYMVARRLKSIEDASAIVCPLRDLRQEIEDCLGKDVTSNLVHSLSNWAI